jgi:hypothetical protein
MMAHLIASQAIRLPPPRGERGEMGFSKRLKRVEEFPSCFFLVIFAELLNLGCRE